MRRVCGAAVLIIALIVVSCARAPRPEGNEKVHRTKDDPVAGSYFKFLKTDLEKYSENLDAPIKTIDELISANPEVGYFYYQRAVLEGALGEWEKVSEDCLSALAKDPKLTEAKILIGRAYGVLNKNSDAIRYLEDAKKSEPDNVDVYILLAKEYLNIKQYRNAERVMLSLLARDTEALVAYYYLGAVYGAYLKQPERAIDMYERLLEREPENLQIIDAISELYLETGKSEKALGKLLELERLKQGDVSLTLKIARIYYKLKDTNEAIRRFEEVLRKVPDSDKIAYYLGILYEEVGRTKDAFAMYLSIPPKSGLYKDARVRLAYQYRVMGDNRRAKEVLHEGIRKVPEIADFYNYLGGIYEREGLYGESAKILTKAVAKFPDDDRLYYALGVLYERMKNVDMAIKMMRKVIELDPENAGALNYIGYSLVEEGRDLDEAEDMLQKAVTLRPDDGYILDSLGWLYFKRGNAVQAQVLLKKALRLVPGEPTVLKHMGEIYLAKGDKAEALRYFKQAIKEWGKKEEVNKDEVEELMSLVKEAMGGKPGP